MPPLQLGECLARDALRGTAGDVSEDSSVRTLLVRHVRAGCLRLLVVATWFALFETGDSRKDHFGSEPPSQERHRAGSPRRTSGTGLDSDRPEPFLPERKVALLDLSQSYVDRRELRTGFGGGHGAVNSRR